MTLQPTPEAYFQALDLDPGAQGALTPQEAAFLRRYAGLLADDHPTPEAASRVSASAAEPKALPTAPAEVPEKAPAISRSETLRLVAFAVAGQQFLLPVGDVQEVVPYQTPTRLPAAPAHIAGIIQLRGRITPIIRLHELLGLPHRPEEDRERFFIICEAHGIQLGLVAHALAPMIQAPAENVDWHIHEHLGDTSDLVQGICKHNGKLMGILSVAALTQIILEPQPGGHHGPPHPHRG